MIFVGAMQFNPLLALISTSAIILTPAFALWLYHRISYGAFSNYLTTIYSDITIKELHCLLPLLILTFWFGIQPGLLINDITMPSLILLATIFPISVGNPNNHRNFTIKSDLLYSSRNF